MDVEKVMKTELGQSVLTCSLCLASESDVKLIFVDLSDFYNFFKPCGVGQNQKSGQPHFNYICQFCVRRAGQCVTFIKLAWSAERLMSHLVQNETVITDTLLHSIRKNHICSPVNLSSWLINDCKDSFHQATCDSDEGRFTEIRSSPTSLQYSTLKSEFLEFNFPLPEVNTQGSTNTNSSTVNHLECADTKIEPTEIESCCNEPTANDSELSAPVEDNPHDEKGWWDSDTGSENEEAHEKKKIDDMLSKTDDVGWLPLEVEPLQLSREQQVAELQSRLQDVRFLRKEFKCYKCAVSFNERQCLEAHDDLHKQDHGDFECEVCARRYASRASLLNHESRHRNRWHCLRCDRVSGSKEQSLKHHASCTANVPVRCKICYKLYMSKVSLQKHIGRMHIDKRTYICDTCGKVFSKKQPLIYHMRIHSQEKPYTCKICGKKSSTSSVHARHMEVHERKDVKDPNLYCVECDKYFKTKKNMDYHYTTTLMHNAPENFKHKCPDCDKCFSLASGLRRHRQRVHIRTLAFACSLCDKAYCSSGSLAAHKRSKHSNKETVRDKVCVVCSKAFKTRQMLRNHARTHTLERPFTCVVCAATFGFSASLYTHLRLKHKTTPSQLRQQAAPTSLSSTSQNKRANEAPSSSVLDTRAAIDSVVRTGKEY